VSDEAATPTGGAEVSARPDASATEQKPQSIADRLKASLFAEPEPTERPERATQPVETEEPAEQKAPVVKAKAEEVEKPADDAGDEQTEASYETVTELAEALGWDLEKVLELEAPTKVDGKEGKARLRDLIKSYQLEGHLNQKLMTHAEEKRAYETERQTFLQQSQQKMMQLDAAAQVASKFLRGEFDSINWQQLSEQNPEEFNRQYVLFQQRQAKLNDIANHIGQERQQAQQQADAQQQAYLHEQMKLLEARVPEWASEPARKKSLGEMGPVFKEAYGISTEELGGVADHRMLLVARDAWQWQKLQKSKPTTLQKVKAAPKLLKPGAQQSRAAQDNFIAQKERERLRTSGKVSDAKAPLKRLLFS
jgi:hypothetical protein